MSTIDFASVYDRYARDVLHVALYLTGGSPRRRRHRRRDVRAGMVATGEIRMETVKAYLLSIARNLHIEPHRLRTRTTELPSELRDPAVSPARAAESRGELQAVMRGLQTISDTTFTVSPRRFIGNAVCAVIAWTVYLVWLSRARKRALGVTRGVNRSMGEG